MSHLWVSMEIWCRNTPAGGLYRFLTPSIKVSNIEEKHSDPPKKNYQRKTWLTPGFLASLPSQGMARAGGECTWKQTPDIKQLIFDTKLFSRAVTKYNQPKISTREAGFVRGYHKEGKKLTYLPAFLWYPSLHILILPHHPS